MFCYLNRLLLWYTVVTALFRCPSSIVELTDESPRVCKPYLIARSHVAPYLNPYYDAYAAPYVGAARPYVKKFEQQVFTPSLKLGKQTYEMYGAPQVEKVRVYGQDQWVKVVKPQLDAAQAQAKTQYNASLAPQVSKASAAAAPYYTAGRENLLEIYDMYLLPAYVTSRPYAEKTYATGRDIAVKHVLPYSQSAWASTVVFIDRTLWPKLRVLYGQNVEPQLVRIGERLGRYRDGKKLKAAVEEIDISSTSSLISSSVSSISSSIASGHTSTTSEYASETKVAAATASSSATPEQEAEQVREKITSDLRNWQDKFAKAADKGSEDLQERVQDITSRQIENQVGGVGEALVIQLEESSKSELAKLKKSVNKIVRSLPEDTTTSDIEKAEEELSKVTRNAGLAVKTKAQALRVWRQKFDEETESLVSFAAESTLDVLDSIRDLGLQEIGMRWAYLDGVTYKDWAKYHEMKQTFDEWRVEVEAVAKDHEGLKSSKEKSEEVESRGMSIAEEAAKELARLKRVGKWKIEAKDDGDDFSTKYMSAAVAAAAQKAAEKARLASEQVIGTPQGTVKSILSEATQQATKAASGASSQVIGSEPSMVEQASSKISEAASIASDKVSVAVAGTAQPKSESVISVASRKASEMVDHASKAIVGIPKPVHESIASEASMDVASAASAVSNAVSGSSTSFTESASNMASSASSSASSITSTATKRVFSGAMAQDAGNRKPILDDIIDGDDTMAYSEKIQSMVNQAGDRYADVTRAVSEALLKVTSTQGTVESVTSVANDKYSSAIAAASSVLHGTQQGAAESVTSMASEKYASAVSA